MSTLSLRPHSPSAVTPTSIDGSRPLASSGHLPGESSAGEARVVVEAGTTGATAGLSRSRDAVDEAEAHVCCRCSRGPS